MLGRDARERVDSRLDFSPLLLFDAAASCRCPCGRRRGSLKRESFRLADANAPSAGIESGCACACGSYCRTALIVRRSTGPMPSRPTIALPERFNVLRSMRPNRSVWRDLTFAFHRIAIAGFDGLDGVVKC